MRGLAIVLALATVGWSFAARAQQEVAGFYKDKTITIIIGFPPGGEYDLTGRLIGRFLGKHIPGNPTVIASNMTGAGGMTAANHLYNVAAKDGTQLAVVANGTAVAELIGVPGVGYDANKFNWIGTLVPTIEVLVLWHTSGGRTLEDVRNKEFVIGASGRGAGSFIMPTVMNQMFGAKLKIVTGYRGGADLNIAMERGETAGRSNSWSSWKTTKADWLAKKMIHLVAYAGPEAKDLAGVPHLNKLAKNEEDRRVLDVAFNGAVLGRPMVAGPGVPPERIAALRKAFDAILVDPEFMAAAKQSKVIPEPTRGIDMQKSVANALSAPPAVVERVKGLMK
jgi:tripartite-type tricarboxylate transporter receptor subunit TctC